MKPGDDREGAAELHARGLAGDLDRALDPVTRQHLATLDRRCVLVTGGTGFVGTWLVELLTWGADRLGIVPDLVLLTRDPARFAASRPHLAAHRAVRLLQGDVRDAPSIPGPVELLVAGAAASIAAGDAADEAAMRATTEANARFARAVVERTGCRMLYLSSGAAGQELPDAYGQAKLAAEELLAEPRIERPAVIARLFTFVGPYLPLGLNFAVGNFIADALGARAIEVQGDGTAVRSYLYGSDLARFLVGLAAVGAPGTRYDVGAPEAVSIGDLASLVAGLVDPPLPVHLHGRAVPSSAPSVYLPDTSALRSVGLVPSLDLRTALRRTLEWFRWQSSKEPPLRS